MFSTCNSRSIIDSLDPQIIEDPKVMLDENNVLTKAFRMARDSFNYGDFNYIKLRLIKKKKVRWKEI